ncbi:MAG: ABC transporter ATP-binding protein [Candidatus Kaiserbacteria bacterium]|nr:ABC transporter ATP-binding protein [Candidatus Kaiserbacteria bacterium]
MKSSKSIWRDDLPLSKSPLRFFLFSSRPHWKAAVLATALATAADVVSASVSYVFKLITNAAAAVTHGAPYTPLLLWCIVYIALLGGAKLFWRLGGFASARWATGAAATARYGLTSYVTLHSRAYFSDRFAGSIMNKIRHAATGMREIVDVFLWEFLELGVNALTSFVIAWIVSPLVAAIFLVWVIVIVSINAYLGYKRVPLAVRAHDIETKINGATVDLLTNVSAMQEYARREFEIERLKAATDDKRIAHLKSWYFGEWTRVVNSILLVVFGSAMVFTAVGLAKTGTLSVGDIVLVLTIIFRVEGLLQSLGSNFNKFAETWGEIEESLDEIIEPHEIPDKTDAASLVVAQGALAFEGVTFSYGANTVFADLNLAIPAGQRVGLVGRSGAGKSTLIRLILRHHTLQMGTIKIDGTDIATVTQESLRQAISVVPQEPLLFHRTISENIAYGRPDASEEEVIQAAKLAHAHEFISRLPQGYASMVGERGVKLSGGERQRIAIARAILKNAPILLLDEATSALDSESEVEIQRALHELMHGKTVIAIAHRLSTLREMDRIIVMDQGRIVEEGTHEQLVARGGIYSELWQHQAGGFLQDA